MPAGARGDLGPVGDRQHLAAPSDLGEEVADPRGGLAAHPGVDLVEDQQRLAAASPRRRPGRGPGGSAPPRRDPRRGAGGPHRGWRPGGTPPGRRRRRRSGAGRHPGRRRRRRRSRPRVTRKRASGSSSTARWRSTAAPESGPPRGGRRSAGGRRRRRRPGRPGPPPPGRRRPAAAGRVADPPRRLQGREGGADRAMAAAHPGQGVEALLDRLQPRGVDLHAVGQPPCGDAEVAQRRGQRGRLRAEVGETGVDPAQRIDARPGPARGGRRRPPRRRSRPRPGGWRPGRCRWRGGGGAAPRRDRPPHPRGGAGAPARRWSPPPRPSSAAVLRLASARHREHGLRARASGGGRPPSTARASGTAAPPESSRARRCQHRCSSRWLAP